MYGESGVSINWVAEHKRGDRLISRQFTVEAPRPLNCLKWREMRKFMRDTMHYLLVCQYHKLRVGYCERNPMKDIPEYYRTGDFIPKSIPGVIGRIGGLLFRR